MSPSWIRSSGSEIEVLVIDERPPEPQVTVRVLGTGEEKTVGIGQITSSEGDLTLYRNADKIIQEDQGGSDPEGPEKYE